MPDETVRPAFTSHETVSVPQDALRSRKAATTASMLDQLDAPVETNSTPFRGYGLYTHAEMNTPQDAPRFAHQKYLTPGMEPKFLPLNGSQPSQEEGEVDEQLPKGVLQVYRSLKGVLLKEEEHERTGKYNDPRRRFECVGLPHVLVPPPPSFPQLEETNIVMAILGSQSWPAYEHRGVPKDLVVPDQDNIATTHNETTPDREQGNPTPTANMLYSASDRVIAKDTTSCHTPTEFFNKIPASDRERVAIFKTLDIEPGLEMHTRLPEHADTRAETHTHSLPKHISNGLVLGKVGLDTKTTQRLDKPIVSNAQGRGEIPGSTISNDQSADLYYSSGSDTLDAGEVREDVITSTHETGGGENETIVNTQDTEDVPDMMILARLEDEHDTDTRVNLQEPIPPNTAQPLRQPDKSLGATSIGVLPSLPPPDISTEQPQKLQASKEPSITRIPLNACPPVASTSQFESLPALTTHAQSQLPTMRSTQLVSYPSSSPEPDSTVEPGIQSNLLQGTSTLSTSSSQDIAMEISSGEEEVVQIRQFSPQAAYKQARLSCETCKKNLKNLRGLVAHMMKNHIDDLGSASFRCCAAQCFNGRYLSSSPHWRGVHGWDKEPFQCPKCDIFFPSIPEVRKHWKQQHISPMAAEPNAISSRKTKSPEGAPPADPKADMSLSKAAELQPSLAIGGKLLSGPKPLTSESESQLQTYSGPTSALLSGPLTQLPLHPNQPPALRKKASKFSNVKWAVLCQNCDTYVDGLRGLVAHIRGHKDDDLSKIFYRCCEDKRYKGTASDFLHMQENHGVGARPFPCHVCNDCFSDLPEVRTHFLQQHNQTTDAPKNKEQLVVNSKPKATSVSQQPNVPALVDNTPSEPFQNLRLRCVICSEDIENILGLTRHVFKHHFEGRLQIRWMCCDMNTSLTSTALKHFSRGHGWRRGLPCPSNTCEKTFESLPQYQKHLKADHSPDENVEIPESTHTNSIECPLCSQTFPGVEAEKAHACPSAAETIASRDKPSGSTPTSVEPSQDKLPQAPSINLRVHCTQCTVDFNDLSELTKHLFQRHRAAFPKIQFECCNIKVNATCDILRHLREAHSQDDILPCPVDNCDKKFENLVSFLDHIGSEHLNSDLENNCILCGEHFSNPAANKSHICAGSIVECHSCKKRFAIASALEHHICVGPSRERSRRRSSRRSSTNSLDEFSDSSSDDRSRHRPSERRRDRSRYRSRNRSGGRMRDRSREPSSSPMDISDEEYRRNEEYSSEEGDRDRRRKRSSGASRCSFCGWDTGHSPVCMHR